MTNEERDEWYYDMIEEHRADEVEEHNMRTDYDHFLNRYSAEVEELQKIVAELKKAHDKFDWEFDLDEVLGL